METSFDWYGRMQIAERRTFWACFGGWALDAMDVQIYSFVIPTLSVAWTLSKEDAGLLATSALLISAFGGWFTGILADRMGRVKLLQITILWFAVFTFISGLTQNFRQLLVVRGLQGLGFGGEWAAGSVLMGEAAPAADRGRAVGSVQAGWAVGWGVAALLATLITQYVAADIGWRVLFFVGILPAFFVFFLRRYVREPAVFAEAHERGERAGIGEIFRGPLLLRTILGSLLAIGAQGGYYAITTWLPSFLREERHLTVLASGGYLGVIIAGSLTGYLVSAWLTDAIGRRPCFFIFSIFSLITVVLYTQLAFGNEVMLVLGFPLGFFASGIFSPMGPLYTELYPTRVRASGQGFCYNFGRGCAALFPLLVGRLAASMPLGTAIGIFAGGAYLVVVLAACGLPETRGLDIRDRG